MLFRSPPEFTEIPSVDESFDLILKLDALLGIVAVALVESAVLSSVQAFCLQRRRPSWVFFPLDLHQDLRTGSGERSVGVVPEAYRPRSLLPGWLLDSSGWRDPTIGRGPAWFGGLPTFPPLLFRASGLGQASVGRSFVRAHILVRALQ